MNEYMRFVFEIQDLLGSLESGSRYRYKMARRFFIVSVIVPLFFSGIIKMTQIYDDFSLFNDILSLVWFGMMGMSKYFTMIHFSHRFTELRDKINGKKINDDASADDDLILEKYDKAAHRYSMIITFFAFAVPIGIFNQNMPKYIRTKVLTLPVDIYYPFNLDQTGWFILAYVHQFLAFAIYPFIFSCALGQFITLTYHACGHFHVLQNYLERIAEDENWVEYGGIGRRERINKCVRLHQNVLKLVEDLEDFHTWPNLIQFLVSAVGLCTSAYELSQEDPAMEQIVKHVCGVAGQFVQLYVNNYCGQLIADTSYEVSRAVYRSNFYNLKPCHQKDLQFLLTRAQKPAYLTAGKFCILCLEGIINVLKATSTYFAMFTAMGSQSEA